MIHNESVNIWTHFFGAVIVLILAIYLFATLGVVNPNVIDIKVFLKFITNLECLIIIFKFYKFPIK